MDQVNQILMQLPFLIRSARIASIFSLVVIFQIRVAAQQKYVSKPVLDTSAIKEWDHPVSCSISPLGKYISYATDQPLLGKSKLIVSDTSCTWRREYGAGVLCSFSSDDRFAIFQIGDSLHFLELGQERPDKVISVQFYQQPSTGRGKWLVYKKKEQTGQLVLMNLLTGKEQNLGQIAKFLFDKNGTALLLEKAVDSVISLELIELKDMRTINLWTGNLGERPSDFMFARDGQQLAFVVAATKPDQQFRSIWHYQAGANQAELKIRDGDPRITGGLKLSQSLEFSNNGRWLFCMLTMPEGAALPRPSPDAVQIDIWSYKDQIVQPAQLRMAANRRYRAVLSTIGDNFQQLEKDREGLVAPLEMTGDIAVISKQDSGWWADAAHHYLRPHIYFLRSIKDGHDLAGFQASSMGEDLSYSPDGRWLVYFDAIKGNYFSYDLVLNRLHNLTIGLRTKFTSDHRQQLAQFEAAPLAGWAKDGRSVLVYDNYDLWQVDLAGQLPANNVTSGYGLAHHIKLRLVDYRDIGKKESVFDKGDTLLLTGFNIDNKYNGFLQQVLGAKRGPELLYMGPYTFFRVASQKYDGASFGNSIQPLRADRAHCWILTRQSAKEAPNYFITSDFKHFKALTHFAPQASYNWLTTELVNYKRMDGTAGQGILYKPENFDPGKKYPVIFHYYEEMSYRMYEFPTPELMSDRINIAWFVSRGYLVFTPDIHFKPATESGKTAGEWAYNAVVAAVHYLAGLPYVDKKRMGIEGHSFGGQQTNYLVTHTHLFAAASEMAGVSDEVSFYLNLLRTNENDLEYVENEYINESGQLRLGSPLWEHPEYYLRESAVLSADKATTPLLIIHNKRDEAVPWRQGVELYMALRRLGKPVWMLQYDQESHGIDNPENRRDYTIRATQFFDYYLKGTLPPKWMTEGVPAKMKGLETGYELDDSGKKP